MENPVPRPCLEAIDSVPDPAPAVKGVPPTRYLVVLPAPNVLLFK